MDLSKVVRIRFDSSFRGISASILGKATGF